MWSLHFKSRDKYFWTYKKQQISSLTAYSSVIYCVFLLTSETISLHFFPLEDRKWKSKDILKISIFVTEHALLLRWRGWSYWFVCVRSKVTRAQRNERWMTGRSPTPSPHVPPKTLTSLVPRGCSPTAGISHLKETLHQKKHIAPCAKLH